MTIIPNAALIGPSVLGGAGRAVGLQ